MPNYRAQIDWELDFQPGIWILILKALAFNAVVSLLFLAIWSLLGKFESIGQFNAGSLTPYFNEFSFSNFLIFFKRHCATGPIAEEIFWKLPVFLLTISNFKLLIGNRNFTNFILWLSLIIPTGIWALDHKPFPFPIFISGLAYGWLIIKTRPSWPWPAVVCHSLANLSLYFFVKILQVLGYAPIN